jgi:2-oxoglutarate dehydrogenase E2 component (dihydrolipoamide succinyltransferase)
MLAALSGQAPIRAVAPAAAPAAASAPAAPAAAVVIPSRDGRTSRKRMSPLRRKIAERLVQAKSETAMLTTFNEVNMAPVMELRKRHGEEVLKKYGIKLGFMSFFVKAAVQAMKEVPAINAQLDGEDIIENHFYDIGVAVGTDKGLMVPVVRDCDQLNFAGIEKAIGDFGKRARDGKIQLPELQGGVFTISNGGIYGSMLSTPILNHPQAAIMGLHNIVERPVAENGQVVIRPIMYLALSYDHRLIDGKEAVTFLVKVRQYIEDPQRLLFGV